MPRTHIHLTEGQIEEIKRRAEKQGLKQSELIRRVVDKGLEPPLFLGTPLEEEKKGKKADYPFNIVGMESARRQIETIDFDMPSYRYGGTNERVKQCVDIITRKELFGCKIWSDEKDIKIALTLDGKFKKYTKDAPLKIGDMQPGRIQVWLEFIDKKRYQRDYMGRRIWPNWIKFSGGEKLESM